MTAEPRLKDVNPDPTRPRRLPRRAARAEIAALARRQERAGGLLMRAVNLMGSSVEDGLRLLPRGVRARSTAPPRRRCCAPTTPPPRSRGLHRARGRAGRAASPATGCTRRWRPCRARSAGLGGLPTALAELPVATTVIFRAVQGVAEANGEDPPRAETRLECLRVFGAGGVDNGETSRTARGMNTSFLGARLSLTGVGINRLVARIAPRFGAVISQKLARQAVPLIGAAAGAGTNLAFTDYYVEMAHVHFGLRRLARAHRRGGGAGRLPPGAPAGEGPAGAGRLTSRPAASLSVATSASTPATSASRHRRLRTAASAPPRASPFAPPRGRRRGGPSRRRARQVLTPWVHRGDDSMRAAPSAAPRAASGAPSPE